MRRTPLTTTPRRQPYRLDRVSFQTHVVAVAVVVVVDAVVGGHGPQRPRDVIERRHRRSRDRVVAGGVRSPWRPGARR